MPLIDGLPFEGVPEPTKAPRYSGRFVKALRVAAIAHGRDCRKGGTIPYITHPLGVCSIAWEYGADEDEAIAALLHDMLEDVCPTDAAIRTVRWFGDRVYRIVQHCTDRMPGPDGKKPPSIEAKAAYVERLKTAEPSALLVSASDKLHNARSIVADLRTDGDRVWERFNVTKDEELDYYGSLVRVLRENPYRHPALVEELARTVDEMWRLAGRRGFR